MYHKACGEPITSKLEIEVQARIVPTKYRNSKVWNIPEAFLGEIPQRIKNPQLYCSYCKEEVKPFEVYFWCVNCDEKVTLDEGYVVGSLMYCKNCYENFEDFIKEKAEPLSKYLGG